MEKRNNAPNCYSIGHRAERGVRPQRNREVMNILDLLDQERAARIRSKALRRLFLGAQRGSLVPAKTALPEAEEEDAKLALILLSTINPSEHMTKGELALLMGVNIKTLALKEAQERQCLNTASSRSLRSSTTIPPQFRKR